MRQLVAAVIGLAAEDRQHDIAGYAELALDARERVAILHGERAALRGEPVEGALFEILRGRQHEFGLASLGLFGTAGNDQIRQRQIGLKPARRGVERRARHAGRLRLRPQRLQETIEGRIGLRGRG